MLNKYLHYQKQNEMKKSIITIAIASMIIAGSAFTSCKSPAEKADDAQADVQDARKDLNEAQNDANTKTENVATAEEWQLFKSEAEAKIRSNEVRINELTIQMNKPGKVFDDLYKKRIQTLEQQNRDLKNRIDAYDKSHTDWETFKREFNHDMDELGEALKNLTVSNKN